MDNEYMNLALEEAKKAYNKNEVPVGAVIIKNNEIIAKTHNLKVKTNQIISHAEILAIMEATEKLNDWRLNECEMYVTLEPCPMCAGAIYQSRIKKIYIGTKSNIKSNETIVKNILSNVEYNHRVEIEYLNDEDCSKIITDFFSRKR